MIIILNKNEDGNDLDEADIDPKFVTEIRGVRIVKVNVDQEDLNILIDTYIKDEK